MKDLEIHPRPYNGTNNRKKTKARRIMDTQIQSVPLYDRKEPEYKNGNLIPRKRIGYRYIQQFVSTR
jgi:hypothetical protein